ncbi:MAG: DUF3413 domain-containing protein [Flavobacterium sp.]|nr:DUF3413 domain-containing protein [Flavobacterium sp.]
MQQSKIPLIKRLYLVFLFNFILLLFIALQYINFLENIDGFMLKVYLGITTISHFFTIGVLPLLVSLLLFFVTKSSRITEVVNIILSTLVLIVVKLDAVIFEQFRYHISPIVLKLVLEKGLPIFFSFQQQTLLSQACL